MEVRPRSKCLCWRCLSDFERERERGTIAAGGPFGTGVPACAGYTEIHLHPLERKRWSRWMGWSGWRKRHSERRRQVLTTSPTPCHAELFQRAITPGHGGAILWIAKYPPRRARSARHAPPLSSQKQQEQLSSSCYLRSSSSSAPSTTSVCNSTCPGQQEQSRQSCPLCRHRAQHGHWQCFFSPPWEVDGDKGSVQAAVATAAQQWQTDSQGLAPPGGQQAWLQLPRLHPLGEEDWQMTDVTCVVNVLPDLIHAMDNKDVGN